ncbi:hypothetical protein BABINDRAFT_169274 [Babjeviella inositovora NRRL Y-12698]|uniref:Small ribosomal subunit protein mS33 n=1 Tax=Babjeviella inositovora NRRL Y-12698 TaxID=984486 RepID=A0A1E3QI90_9ASCO|nr:uncharacterized protein BABINDRAFT_169274 [Babjeviella inositovora NRRL Y-12698]ODQ77411.1 hypothetical protein BABINDRAFT_169274 [Babjeviella inositovora NRRL Y-12698]
MPVVPNTLTPAALRLAQLIKLSCGVFNEVYNPTQIRTGAKYLKRKLKGHVTGSYYTPNSFPSVYDLKKHFPKEIQHRFITNEDKYKLHMTLARKRRGKGKPKKKDGPPPEDPKSKKK